jgi:oligopeptide/dipeptide ABC transporter ATP-binding protein
MSTPILKVTNLKKHFPIKNQVFSSIFNKNKNRLVKAVDGVSFEMNPTDSVAIVGESGCGKTTMIKTILRLMEPTDGQVWFDGKNISSLKSREVRELRKDMQIVYQDPYEALNPKQKILDILLEPLIANRIGDPDYRMNRAREVLQEVGLTPVDQYLLRFPHELSGGQRQRVAIASALTVNPKLIIADEPVSMLDISKRMDIIHLLKGLKEKKELSLLIITHDIPIAKHLANKMMVMYLGTVVEIGDTEQIIKKPKHPYTKALISVVEVVDRLESSAKMILPGEAPNPIDIPSGCRFHNRCSFAQEKCKKEEPILREITDNQQIACHFDL